MAAAAHLISSPPAASPLNSRPILPPHARRFNHRAEASRSLSCRASLGPDGSLAALAATRPAAPRGRSYLRERSCLIFPPPRGRRPLAVVKFIGGAFIGAVPEITYGHLPELLAKEGRNLTTASGRRPRGGGKMRQERSRRYDLPRGGAGLMAASAAREPSGPSDARQERLLEASARWLKRRAWGGRMGREFSGEAAGGEERR